MKKILVFCMAIIVGFSIAAFAESWHTANIVKVAWDAVETNENGDPIDSAEISYAVYFSNAVSDPEKSTPVQVTVSDNESATVTIGAEGKYFVGVKAIRTVNDEIVGESVIAWSDDPQSVGEGNEFGVQYFLPPAAPGGLRPQ